MLDAIHRLSAFSAFPGGPEGPLRPLRAAALAAGLLVCGTAVSAASSGAATPAAPSEQGTRIVRVFGPADTGAPVQSWESVEDPRGVVYVANLSGVLEYDGVKWRQIHTPNGSAVYSLAVSGSGRVAVGAFGELGYLAPDETHTLRYVSLLDRLPKALQPLPEIRSTFSVAEGFVFVSESHAFLWDEASGPSVKVLPAPAGDAFLKAFLVNGQVVFVTRAGLLRLTGGTLEPVPGDRLAGRTLVALLPASGKPAGTLLAADSQQGLILLEGGLATPVAPETSRWLVASEVAHGLALDGGRYLFTTRRAGFAILKSDLTLEELLDSDSGLPDPDVFSARLARDGALWLVLRSSGLARLDLGTRVTQFDERNGLRGNVLAVARHEGRLFAGSSAGLFVWEPGEAGGTSRPGRGRFRPVPGSGWAQYALLSLGDRLLAGSARGVLEVTPDGAGLVPGTEGLRSYALTVSRNDPSRVWVGHRDGLLVLRRLEVEDRLPGVKALVRSIAETPEGELFLGTVFSGVLRVSFQPPIGPGPLGKPGVTALGGTEETHVALASGRLLASTGTPAEGRISFVDPVSSTLVPENEITGLLRGRFYFSLTPGRPGELWVNTAPPSLLTRREDGTYRLDDRLLRGAPGRDVQMLVATPDGEVWFGNEEGLFRYDGSGAPPERAAPVPLLRQVTANGRALYGGDGQVVELDRPLAAGAASRLRFECATARFEPRAGIRYRYRLEGEDDAWSLPTEEPVREYTNVAEGRYVFRVKAEDGSGESGETSFSFRVLPPWWRTWWALLAWALGLGLLVRWGLLLRDRALRQRNAELARRVAERTDELATAVKELGDARAALEERNRALGEANERLTTLSYRDGLTGVANRRHLDDMLAQEWSRAFRAGTPISFILADIDHFKKLNDALGHQEGDVCLRKVAEVLAENARRSGDLAARFGGEEFGVLLPGAPEEAAFQVAETMRARLAELKLPHPASPLGFVTASFGVATFRPRDGGTAQELVASADEALYAAKKAGRNRVG